MVSQAHSLGRDRALVVVGVAPVWRRQRDDPLVFVRAQEVARTGEAGVFGFLDAHAKADAACVEHGDQPARWLAPVHQQQIAAGEPNEVLEQHQALTWTLCKDVASIISASGG